MEPITGKEKSVRQLLQGVKYSIDYYQREYAARPALLERLRSGVKYSIDYYQREYRWESRQVQELLDDLTGTFFDAYEPGISRASVKSFPHYFLGSIVISQRDNENFIVDGQQRLTSLTLLLMLTGNLQRGSGHSANVNDLIFSEQYGERTFNLAVEDREPVMKALFEDEPFGSDGQSESAQNLCNRYQDMEEYLPKDAVPEDFDQIGTQYHRWLEECQTTAGIAAA